ncbi:hypothetical protein FOZ63_006906, partial [Perkinsus olseni]
MRQCPSDWEVTAEGFKCTICGCTVNSEGCMDMHLLGSGHRKKKESLEWQRRATATTTTTTTATATPSSQQPQSASMTTTPPSSDDVTQGDNWDLSHIPEEERCFIRWDDQRGYVCICCDAACCTVEILQVHLQGKKHTSKSNDNAGLMIDITGLRGESIGLVIFEDHTIWEETNTGWRCKLCDAAVNSDSMGMAHMSSRKHQTNLAWASTTAATSSSTHPNNNPGAAVDIQWRAGSYDEDTQFHIECTYQFYGNRDKPVSFGHVDNTGPAVGHAPAHNDWMDSRCKLCETGDICGWGAWSAHFNGKAHKKNVRVSKYEYQAVWQKLDADGFEYYYDHLTGLWDSTNPVEDEIEAFPEDGILYI